MTRLLAMAGQWQGLSRLLDEALSLAPQQRQAWLDRLDGADAGHRAVLEELLATQAGIETGDFLAELPALHPPAPADVPVPGAIVGGYRLVEPLGEGGMGVVWRAERSDGLVKRPVALKLPRAAWGGGFAERLARERDILARLEHEHIARLYDAGVDAQGRPYLAMELVDGQPITTYCQHHELAARARVALLVQVADAVSYAHARLVVHRDLKPGNILVNREGRARLLDFGVAKLLAGDFVQATALTALSGRALTLDYASPEQIAGEPLGTGSDVYSLAVVAYEVLTGRKPYRLKRGTAAELEEAIASAEIAPASTAADAPAARRQLRGDLDAILNRALKRRPEDRYPTMDAFAQDLRRFLAGEPVEARPDGWRYRATKFVRRHRLQVAAGGAVGMALLAGTSVALWQAREAQTSAQQARVEAATATAVQGFLESVFNANSKLQLDPRQAGATTARELLDRGAERIATDLAAAPQAQLRLYHLMGQMYGGMWQYEPALAMFSRALDLATRLNGPGSDQALHAAASAGRMLDDLGRRDDALAMLGQADAAARARAADADMARMQIDAGLARLYIRTDLPKALERARRAAGIARAHGATQQGIDALQILGEVARTADRLEEARAALAEAVDWTARLDALGVQSVVLAELGKVQDRLGEVEAAGDNLKRAAALGERFGDTAVLHNARFELARFQVRNRQWRDALQTAGPEVAWARAHRANAEMRHLPALVMANYARALLAHGDAAGALAAFDEARAFLPPESTPALRGQLGAARASALVSLGRLAEAGADIDRAVAQTAGRGERVIEDVRITRRRYLVAIGKAGEALQDFLVHPPAAAVTPPLLQLPRRIEEAWLRLAAGDAAGAMRTSQVGLTLVHGLPERRYAGDAEARLQALLGDALLKEGRGGEALPVLRKALALALAVYDEAKSPDVARLRQLIAQAERPAR